MPAQDDSELAAIYMAQVQLAPDLGLKLTCCYEALVKLVGETEASKQVWEIVESYLKESVA